MIRFLIWKDGAGKTKVHKDSCPSLGIKGLSRRECLLSLLNRVFIVHRGVR